nr:MAG TPA: hypothetical protein [Caudoviricetes sp.]
MKDIVLEDDDLKIVGGDLFVGDSSQQGVELLLRSMQGEWKEHPDTGCALEKAQGGSIDRFFVRNIRVQLEADGFSVDKLNVTTQGIELNGNYK